RVIVTSLARDQPPAFQPVEPAYGGRTGHAQIGGDLGDRKRLSIHIAERHAKGDEERFQARTKRFVSRSVGTMDGAHDVDHQTADHHSLLRIFNLVRITPRQASPPSLAAWRNATSTLGRCRRSKSGGYWSGATRDLAPFLRTMAAITARDD